MSTRIAALSVCLFVLSGCTMYDHHSETRNASSLVGFLYPEGKVPPPENAIPQLRVPLRVGLAFLPSEVSHRGAALTAASKAELLSRIRQRFADRKFIAEIVEIPDYYLKTSRGFVGLEGVQRLYNVDVMALVSYDQVTYQDDNKLSLGYMTIIGAYVLKGTSHDVSTLVDLAIVDPATRSLVLRAGGVDTRRDTSTLVDGRKEARQTSAESFGAATDHLIENFDAALTKFEADVRAGKANVKVVNRNASASSGGGPFSVTGMLIVLLMLAARRFTDGHCRARYAKEQGSKL